MTFGDVLALISLAVLLVVSIRVAVARRWLYPLVSTLAILLAVPITLMGLGAITSATRTFLFVAAFAVFALLAVGLSQYAKGEAGRVATSALSEWRRATLVVSTLQFIAVQAGFGNPLETLPLMSLVPLVLGLYVAVAFRHGELRQAN